LTNLHFKRNLHQDENSLTLYGIREIIFQLHVGLVLQERSELLVEVPSNGAVLPLSAKRTISVSLPFKDRMALLSAAVKLSLG
jgi:hypothetical protein